MVSVVQNGILWNVSSKSVKMGVKIFMVIIFFSSDLCTVWYLGIKKTSKRKIKTYKNVFKSQPLVREK